MEFEDEHDEEQEEEEDDEEITIPPPTAAPPHPQPQPPPPQAMVQPSYDSIVGPNSAPSRPRVNQLGVGERRSGVVRYRECLKNHAVSIGGHAVDGCGEFMAAGEEGTLDALKCAACNCHRNFHRKETDITAGGGTTADLIPPHANPSPVSATTPPGSTPSGGALYPQFSAYYRTPAPHQHHPHPAQHQHQHQQHNQYRPLAVLPSTSGGTHSGDMADDMSHPSSSGGEGRSGGAGGGVGSGMMMVPKKRHRTKFTQEQKDKMLAFAEKLGWRIQKHDEAAVQQFCAEVQVKRQVLKVWMHNNKHTLGKKP